MSSLAIIPARGGSVRVPLKNLAIVGSTDLIGHALASAEPCDAAVISTDSDEIWRRCVHRGALMHRRKPEHATADAQIEPVIADVLREFGDGVDRVVLLQPTSPLRTAARVRQALDLLADTGADSVVSVTYSHHHYPAFWGEVYDGRYYPRKPDAERLPSSKLAHLCHENGAIYAFTREHFARTGSRMGGVCMALGMRHVEGLEVDTPEDLEDLRWVMR